MQLGIEKAGGGHLYLFWLLYYFKFPFLMVRVIILTLIGTEITVVTVTNVTIVATKSDKFTSRFKNNNKRDNKKNKKTNR